MKLVLVALAIIGVASALPSLRSLQNDFEDIIRLLPRDDMRPIIKGHLATDPEFQSVIRYLQSDDWAQVKAQIQSHPTWVAFKEYLNGAGVDIESFIAFVGSLIENAEVPDLPGSAKGFKDFFDELFEVIPTDDILAMVYEKLETSEFFQDFYDTISGDASRAFVDEIGQIAEVQRVGQVLRGFGIDVDGVLAAFKAFLQWE